MTYRLVLPLASILAGTAVADPADQIIRGLDECFVQARTVDSICESLTGNASARLACLQTSRNARQECLDHLRAGLADSTPPASPEPVPPAKAPPEAAPEPGTPAPQAAEGIGSVSHGPPRDMPQDENMRAPAKPSAPAAIPPSPPQEPRTLSAPGWIVSATASPVDYSPSLTAELRSATESRTDAPSALVLRCRAARTGVTIRTQGMWVRTRGGDIEIVIMNDERPAEHLRWRLSADGRSATPAEDAAKIVQGLSDGRLSIAVNDARGEAGRSTFELAGIQAVRDKLAATCR